MDLSKLNTRQAAETGFELQLVHPSSGEPLELFVTVLGRDSEMFTKLQNEQMKKRLNKAAKSARSTFDADEIDRNGVELIAACTKSWRQDEKTTITFEGDELECNRGNAIRIYTALPWMREQVDAAVMDRANFLVR